MSCAWTSFIFNLILTIVPLSYLISICLDFIRITYYAVNQGVCVCVCSYWWKKLTHDPVTLCWDLSELARVIELFSSVCFHATLSEHNFQATESRSKTKETDKPMNNLGSHLSLQNAGGSGWNLRSSGIHQHRFSSSGCWTFQRVETNTCSSV